MRVNQRHNMRSRGNLRPYTGRGRQTKPLRDVILIVCVGETEQIYFDKFKLDLGKVKVKTIQEAVSPKQLIERAVLEKTNGNYAQVWCVFDKDDYDDYDEAVELAERKGIRVAYSNQAFEIWYILHFEKTTAALHRDHYRRRLSALLEFEYSKTDPNVYKKLKVRVVEAIQNAKWGYQRNKIDKKGRPSSWESSTTVYQLVEELRRWLK